MKSEMDILKLNFCILNYCGLWWPEQSTSWKRIACTMCTITALIMIYIFTLTQLLDMVFGNYGIDEITNDSFLLLTMISLCFKATYFAIHRKSVISVLEILRKDICRHRNNAEANIQKQFDYIARRNTVILVILAELTAIGFLALPILTAKYNERILPFKAWLPYSLSNYSVYWVMYIQQIISTFISANANVSTDTLVSGLLVQACAQLDILKDRIINITNRKPIFTTDAFGQPLKSADEIDKDVLSTIKICVKHHIVIHKFAAEVQTVFGSVVFFQFFISMLTLCSSIFKLSRLHTAGVEIASLMGYLVCMLLQLFFYCWHGNEVKLKSLGIGDAVFATEWTLLPSKTVKSLTMLIARSNVPIQIICGSIFSLSLETYTMILNSAYSAFNLLQNS